MVFSDSIGNTFLGDAIYSEGAAKLTGVPYGNLGNALSTFFPSSTLKYRLLPTQAILDNNINNSGFYSFLVFGTNSDTIDDRFNFSMGSGDSTGKLIGMVNMFDNLGNTATTNLSISANGNDSWVGINRDGTLNISGSSAAKLNFIDFSHFVGVSDGESLALLHFAYDSSNNFYCRFYYAGRLADVNPHFAYYNTSIETDTVIMTNTDSTNARTVANNQIRIGHRIKATRKHVLETGKAIYPIVCADGQNPTSQWATDMYVFDNDATIGSPCIGRVRNLLLAQGTFTIGKVYRIQGTVVPDAGFNRWIAIGTFAGKTVLMRCYSSVNI